MLSPEDRQLIDEFRKASDGESPEGLAVGMEGVSGATLRRIMKRSGYPSRMEASTRKALRSFVQSRADGERQDAPAARPLDEWGRTNARVMERLAGLLERDQVIIEMRARAELLRLELAAAEAGISYSATPAHGVAEQGAGAIRAVERTEGKGNGAGRAPGDPPPPETERPGQ